MKNSIFALFTVLVLTCSCAKKVIPDTRFHSVLESKRVTIIITLYGAEVADDLEFMEGGIIGYRTIIRGKRVVRLVSMSQASIMIFEDMDSARKSIKNL